MISLTTYKFLHIVSIIFIFISIGGLSLLAQKTTTRKLFAIIHGLFMVVLFVAGFGLIARLHLSYPWPAWVWLKLVGWLLVGMAPKFTKTWSPVTVLTFYGLVGTCMAYLAFFKPF